MSGEVLKAEKDFTKEVDKAIPEAESLANVILPRYLHALSILMPLLEQPSSRC